MKRRGREEERTKVVERGEKVKNTRSREGTLGWSGRRTPFSTAFNPAIGWKGGSWRARRARNLAGNLRLCRKRTKYAASWYFCRSVRRSTELSSCWKDPAALRSFRKKENWNRHNAQLLAEKRDDAPTHGFLSIGPSREGSAGDHGTLLTSPFTELELCSRVEIYSGGLRASGRKRAI